MINPEDITIYDSSVGFTNGKEFKLEITRLDVNELINIRKEILDNQENVKILREALSDVPMKYNIEEYYELALYVLGDKK